MSIYRHLDYRRFIRNEIFARKQLGSPLNFSRLSEKSRIQNTYLSNVLNGRAHLNSDQLYAVAEVLELGEDEIDYLHLLLEFNKSESARRKERLLSKIKSIQNEYLETEKHIKAKPVDLYGTPELTEYYLDSYTQIIHVMLGLEGEFATPEKIAWALGISEGHVESCLQTLKKISYIKVTECGNIEVIQKNFHLPRESNLSKPNQVLLRMRALDQIQKVPEEKRKNFSVTFSSDEKTFEEIHSLFLDFLKKCEPLVKKAPPSKAFQMNFDLFPWSIR